MCRTCIVVHAKGGCREVIPSCKQPSSFLEPGAGLLGTVRCPVRSPCYEPYFSSRRVKSPLGTKGGEMMESAACAQNGQGDFLRPCPPAMHLHSYILPYVVLCLRLWAPGAIVIMTVQL